MHFQIAVIGGRIRAIREWTLQRLLTGVCTNVDYQNTPRHRGVFAIRVGTLVRLLAVWVRMWIFMSLFRMVE